MGSLRLYKHLVCQLFIFLLAAKQNKIRFKSASQFIKDLHLPFITDQVNILKFLLQPLEAPGK